MTAAYRFAPFFLPDLHFSPSNDPVDLPWIERMVPLYRLFARYFRTEFVGLENIPYHGPALLVGNHGLIGFDYVFLMAEVYRKTARVIRSITDRHVFLIPGMSQLYLKTGAIDGTFPNALSYLEHGHLVNVYPGGNREAFKAADQRYLLQWEKSRGFIRLAMRAGVPIIPHMAVGPDDALHVLTRLRSTRYLFGHEKYTLPVTLGWGPLPRPVKFRFHIGEPIHLEGGSHGAEDPALVERNHRLVWDRAQALLNQGLRQRRNLWLG